MKTFYVAGPMSGIPYFNYQAFNAAAQFYRGMGFVVYNPAEMDAREYGADISNPTGSVEQAAGDHGFDRARALRQDIRCITDECTGVVMLPGWEKSVGARAEHAIAVALNLEIIYHV